MRLEVLSRCGLENIYFSLTLNGAKHIIDLFSEIKVLIYVMKDVKRCILAHILFASYASINPSNK